MDPIRRPDTSGILSRLTPSALKKRIKSSNRWKTLTHTISVKGLRKGNRSGKTSNLHLFRTRSVKARAQLNSHPIAQKTNGRRTLSAKEFCQISGGSPDKDKELASLCLKLDLFNKEIASGKSVLSPTEQVQRTLTLRQEVVKYYEHKRDHSGLFSFRIKKRMQAADLAIAHLDGLIPRFMRRNPASFSADMAKAMCNDLKQDRGVFVTHLFQNPELMEVILSNFSYVDLMIFMDQLGLTIPLTDSSQIEALTKSTRHVLSQLSSTEIKFQREQFLKARGDSGVHVMVTGNSEYDRNYEFSWLMNHALDPTPSPREMSIAMYQAYRRGHLTMNMLDEMSELKAQGFTMALSDPNTLRQAASHIDKDAMKSMQVVQKLGGFDPNPNSPSDILWFSKICQFDFMLKGDYPLPNKRYRDFIKTWDRLRFSTIPDYNTRHGREDLVILDKKISLELAKISPAWLKKLDYAAGNPGKVAQVLAETGWQKVPDGTRFNKLLIDASQIDDKEMKQQMKKLALQDCLYRFCEQRAGVELPASVFLPGASG